MSETDARGRRPGTGFEAGTDNSTTTRYAIAPFLGGTGPTRVSQGKVTGHGEFSFRTSTKKLELPAPGTLAADQRRPVVVLLDGRVRATPDLADDYHVEAVGWSAPPDDAPAPTDPDAVDGKAVYPSHYAHATFVVGLLRTIAPDARVLSIPVASAAGHADERTIVKALRWLRDEGLGEVDALGRLAVVLLPSGRRLAAWQAAAELADRETVLEDLRHEIVRLGASGVRFVTSAGNWGTDERAYPAWFAQDLPNAVAVGALDTKGQRSPFSSWGDWVRAWELGTHLLSCTPFEVEVEPGLQQGGTATWGGTSFAAALHAGRLAQTGVRFADGTVATVVEPTPTEPEPDLPPPSP